MSYSYVPDDPLARMQRHAKSELREWTRTKARAVTSLASAERMEEHWTNELASIEEEQQKREGKG